MKNKELKQELNRLKTEPFNILFLFDRSKKIERLNRWIETDDIVTIFSELINEYIVPSYMVITITNKPIESHYNTCVLYDYDGYKIEYRNEQKLHIIGLSRKDFKTIKNRFEAKGI